MFILWETCLPLTRSELQCHWQWWPGCPPIWPGWTMLILYQSILIRRNKARRTIVRQFCTIKQERPTQAKPDATAQSLQAGQPPGAEGGGVCVPEYFLSQQSYILYSIVQQPSTTSTFWDLSEGMNIEGRRRSVYLNILSFNHPQSPTMHNSQSTTIHNPHPQSPTIHWPQSTIFMHHQMSGF